MSGFATVEKKAELLSYLFPKEFLCKSQFTWTRLLDEDNWSKLREGVKGKGLHTKMKALIEKFTGGEP